MTLSDAYSLGFASGVLTSIGVFALVAYLTFVSIMGKSR